jgi:subtilisin family serine protease
LREIRDEPMMQPSPICPWNVLEVVVKRFPMLLMMAVVAACSSIADDAVGPSPNAIGAGPLLTESQDLRDRYIVVLRADARDDVAASASSMGGTVHFRYAHALKGFAATLPAQALAALQQNPQVDYIVADGIATISAAGSDNSLLSGHWGLDRIDQRDLPGSGGYSWTHDGAGVRSYILDTGILTGHVAFGGRASVGADFIGDGRNGQDCNGHGTHVAGTVGGAEHGVARATSLVAVRVLNCAGSGTWAQVIGGVDWVAGNHVKPAVANMSLGGGENSALDDAVNGAVAAGVSFVVAAGNSNANACSYSPAGAADAITVGSTTSSDARSSFSNYGSCVDIFAPGSGITSAWHTTTTATNTISGTSMASPHAAGVAAIYLSANSSATPAQVGAAMINGSTPNKVTNPGTGSPNRLLYSLIAGGSPPPPPSGLSLTAVGSKSKGIQQAQLTWSPSGSGTVTITRTGTSGASYATNHDGSHLDVIGAKGAGSYQYRVCVTGTSTCSSWVPVTF